MLDDERHSDSAIASKVDRSSKDRRSGNGRPETLFFGVRDRCA